MTERLSDDALARLFTEARTHSAWRPIDVPDSLLHQIVETLKYGPTSANCSPARFVFVKSPQAKARLKPHLSAGNVDKTMSAPVTVVVGQDLEFYEHLPKLFPHADARSWFAGKDDVIRTTAIRNSSLQGAYLILAARALGLDAGPMSGFDQAGVDREFFGDTSVRSNFLVNLGYGDPAALHPRSPRFTVDEIASIL